MAKVTAIMHLELKEGVNGEDFERFVVEEYLPTLDFPGWSWSFQKGNRGEREGKYVQINTFESVERRDELWPGGEAGAEVKQWFENHQALAEKFSTFADRVGYTHYVEIG